MRSFFIVITLMVSLTMGVFGLKYAGIMTWEDDSQTAEEWKAKKIPEVSFKKLDGTSFSLSSISGKIILLNFWASWCGPCVEEFPKLIELVEKFQGKVALVAVSNDSEKEDIIKFIKKFEAKYSNALKSPDIHMLWDPSFEIAQNQFNVLRLPETFILNLDKEIVKKVIGLPEWEGDQISEFISKQLK